MVSGLKLLQNTLRRAVNANLLWKKIQNETMGRGDEGWNAKKEREKTFELHVNWITTPWADLVAIDAQLWSIMTTAFDWDIFPLNWMAQGFFPGLYFFLNFYTSL